MNGQILHTEKIVFGGDCIAKIDGKTVFVPFALPGETLRVEITESRRDYDRAKITEILEPSPHRVTPPCPLYGKCGGCNFMHSESSSQISFRKQILYDCFLRAGISENEMPEIEAVTGPEFGYRARFQFTDGGLLERGTKNVIPLKNCPVAENAINAWLSSVPQKSRPRGRIHVFGGSFCGDRVTVAQENNFSGGDFSSFESQNRSKKIKSKTPRQIFSGTIISPENTVSVTLSGKQISFDVRGFFQSNMFVLEKAVSEICKFSESKNLVDIYSGCGTFSVFLANHAENITLVEHNRDALVFAEQNLAGTRHASFGLSGAKWVAQQVGKKFDGVVIDPPRSGMEKEVLKWLCTSKPKQINAVSCNPSTHARDIAALIKAGYRLERLLLLDFYPQTSHVESLAVLVNN